jgi:hypothetical protein
MGSLLLGIAAAAAASTLYSLGIAVQALDARDVHTDHNLRITLIGQLLRRVRWLAGTGMTLLGWPLQIIALSFAPLVVVQPALAAGLVVLLVAGQRMLGEHAGRREFLAVAAIVAGVVGVAIAAPSRTTAHTDQATLVIVLSLLAVSGALPYLLRFIGRSVPTVTMLGAGIGFAWSGLVTKFVSDAIAGNHWLTAAGWAAASGVSSGIAVISEMSALQVRPAIQVAPVVFVVQTLVPVALAPLLLHESFLETPLDGAPLLACLGVLLVGAAVLARSPLLLALMAPQEAQLADSGSVPSRSAASSAAKRSSARSEADDPSSVTTTTSPARSGR